MIDEAIRVILMKCSQEIVREALITQRSFALKSPMAQTRYSRLLEKAFASGVEFTADEKAILAGVLDEIPPNALREVKITVRLTVAEKEELRNAAKAAGQSFSDYVRERLLGRRST